MKTYSFVHFSNEEYAVVGHVSRILLHLDWLNYLFLVVRDLD